MNLDILKKVISVSSIAYTYNRIIYDDTNKPIDMEFIEVNSVFEMITGFKAVDLINKRITEIGPVNNRYYLEFIKRCGEMALVEDDKDFEVSLQIKDQYYRVRVFSPEIGKIIMAFIALDNIESSLVENEQRLKIITNNMPGLIWVLDFKTYRINYVNPSVQKILGFTIEDIYQKKIADTVTPKSLSFLKKLNKELFKEIDSDKFERFITAKVEHYDKDGSIILMEHKFRILRNQKGEPIEIIGVGYDITEKHKIEEQLKESERSKSVLLANFPGMAYRCNNDEDWTMQYVSQGCFELTGYYPENLINNQDLSYNDLIYIEDRDLVRKEWTKVIESKGSFKQEYRIVTETGDIKWVLEQGQAIYTDDYEVMALEGFIFDITDQKQKEERIKYLSYHDSLTGLYNRIYFEEVKKKYDQPEYLPLVVMMGDINGLKFLNDAFGHAEGDKLLVETAKIIQNCCDQNAIISRTGGDEFTILFPNTTSEEAYEVLKHIQHCCNDYNSYTFNEAYHINISLGYAVKEYPDEDFDLIQKQAEDYMYKRKLLDRNSSHSALLQSIKSTMLAKSQETEEHCERMQKLARIVGQKLNLTENELDDLALAIALHDIGKVGISDKILQKPGKLNDEEWIEMRKHPEIGYRIAMASPEFVSIAKYILSHHERWDGTGYPNNLKGEEIPLLSRIISIVDAFDAMTNERSYRKALTKEEAIQEIRKCSGTQFDPLVVMVFLEIFSEVDEYKQMNFD